jgi:hypothetical protein
MSVNDERVQRLLAMAKEREDLLKKTDDKETGLNLLFHLTHL